jgi:hypothetical protein
MDQVRGLMTTENPAESHPPGSGNKQATEAGSRLNKKGQHQKKVKHPI